MNMINDSPDVEKRRKIKLLGKTYNLPQSRTARIIIGILLVIGGIFGFLPILGLWMAPLGIFVLSHDISAVRKFRRKMGVRFTRWRISRRNNSN